MGLFQLNTLIISSSSAITSKNLKYPCLKELINLPPPKKKGLHILIRRFGNLGDFGKITDICDLDHGQTDKVISSWHKKSAGDKQHKVRTQ